MADLRAGSIGTIKVTDGLGRTLQFIGLADAITTGDWQATVDGENITTVLDGDDVWVTFPADVEGGRFVLTSAGSPEVVGRVSVSRYGTPSPDGTVTVLVGDPTVTISVVQVPDLAPFATDVELAAETTARVNALKGTFNNLTTDVAQGALSGTLDPSGRFTYYNAGSNPYRIESGFLRQAATNGAGYLTVDVGKVPRSVGMKYEIQASGTNDGDAALVCIIVSDIDPETFDPNLPIPFWQAIHFSISATAWYMQFIDNDETGELNLTSIWGDTFAEPLPAGEHLVAMEFDGRFCRAHLPDGSIKYLEDERFLDYIGQTVTYETIMRPAKRQAWISQIGTDDATVLNPEVAGEQVIAEVLLSSSQATIAFSDIPKGFKDLRIDGLARASTAAATEYLILALNGDTATANYDTNRTQFSGTTATTTQSLGGSDSRRGPLVVGNSTVGVGTTYSPFEMVIPGYRGAQPKSVYGRSSGWALRTSNGAFRHDFVLCHTGTDPITDIELGLATGGQVFMAGSWVRLIGTRTLQSFPRPHDA